MDSIPTQSVDLVALVSAGMALLLVLIPMLGFAIRIAAGPLVDAFVASRGEGARPVDLDALRTRVDALEQEVQELSSGVTSLVPRDRSPVPLRP